MLIPIRAAVLSFLVHAKIKIGLKYLLENFSLVISASKLCVTTSLSCNALKTFVALNTEACATQYMQGGLAMRWRALTVCALSEYTP